MDERLRSGAGSSGLGHGAQLRELANAPAIHPSAVIDPRAVIGEDVVIGPHCVVGPGARIGARVKLGSNVVIEGDTELGEDVRVWHGAVLGAEPQDRHSRGEPSRVRVGPRTQLRQHATVPRATGEGAETVIGADVLVMASAHVAHNCRVSDGATLANGALLAGHAEVGARAIVSGNSVVHQFARIGRMAMIGGVARDVPPFALVVGDSVVRGVNGVGVRRGGVTRDAQAEIHRIYQLLFRRALPLAEALGRIEAFAATEAGREIVRFPRAPSKRGLCRGGVEGSRDGDEE